MEVNNALKEQLEYYFSDSNYRKDKFLKEQASKNEGYIPIECLLTFNRMKSLNVDLNAVVTALKTIEGLEVKDDKLVKRSKPLPEVDDHEKRTVFVKNLPAKYGPSPATTEATIESIKETMSKFGKVMNVTMKRNKKKVFIGKAFVEFSTEEEAKKACEAKETEYPGITEKLNIKSFEAYDAKRKLYEQDKPDKPQKVTKTTNEVTKKEEEPEAKPEMIPGCLVVITNATKGLRNQEWKQFFAKYGKVRYVEIDDEKQRLTLRFFEPEFATACYNDLKEKKIQNNDQIFEGYFMEGDEEKKYWEEKVIPSLTNAKKRKREFPGGGRRGKKGRRF